MKTFLDLAERFRSTAVVDDDFPMLKYEFDRRLEYLHRRMPKIVCLCGSTRFKDVFIQAYADETDAGHIVLSVGRFVPQAEIVLGVEKKAQLDELHKRKIDLCDEVLVLNVGGYIGTSTRSEIEYALSQRKPVRYLEAQGATL